MAKGWDTFKAWMAEGAKDLHNNIVPAFPSYAHGVDEPGTPQNPRAELESASASDARPSFADRMAELASQTPAASRQIEPGIEP